MAGFPSLTNDDDREKKASFHRPGTFNTVLRPRSFSSVTDYDDEQNQTASGSGQSPTQASRSEQQEPSKRRRSVHIISPDTNWVFLDKFEEEQRQLDSGELDDMEPVSPPPVTALVRPHSFRQIHSSPHIMQSHNHSQTFSTPTLLYSLPGLRPYRSHPIEPTYISSCIPQDINYTIPPMIPRMTYDSRDSPRATPRHPHPLQLQQLNNNNNTTVVNPLLPLSRINEDTRSSTPFRRVSIPLNSTSGSLLEEIVGLGNAPFFRFGGEDEYEDQQQQ